MLKKTPLLLIFLFCNTFYSQNNAEVPLDSVNKYLTISDSIHFPEKKIKYLDKAFSFAEELDIDSLLIEISSKIAHQNVLLDNKENFKKANNGLLKIYQNKKDSTALGLYYKNNGWYFENNSSIDSAYYYYNKAKIVFKTSKNKRLKSIYYELLNVNLSINDYIGVEELAIEILENESFKTDYKTLGIAYDCLGTVSSSLQDYKNALKYHQEALKTVKKITDDQLRKTQEVRRTNNVGLTYLSQEKYKMALSYFLETLKIDPDLKKNDIAMYAVLMLNMGISEVEMGRTRKGFDNINTALRIAEEIKDYYTQTSVLLDFALLYKKAKNLTKAKEYVDKAMVLAKKINHEKLRALKLSAEIYTGKESIAFYKKYIVLQEEIEKKEQNRKNKFARARFETQKKEEENTKLKQEGLIAKAEIKDEQNKSRIVTLVALVSLLLTVFVFIFYKSRQKILTYKANLEKAQAREQERQEIAVSLHDKVVGDLRLIYERALKSNVDNIAEPLSRVNSEIRNLSHKLGSVDFNEVSFKNQIINLVSDYYSPEFKIKIKNLDKIDWSLVESQIKRTLYLVIRESIQNSKKYAFAPEVLIDFKRKYNTLQLSIKDNGNGFDLKSIKFGLGLKSQKKRVEELNGNFNLESVLKLGTTTTVKIPLRA